MKPYAIELLADSIVCNKHQPYSLYFGVIVNGIAWKIFAAIIAFFIAIIAQGISNAFLRSIVSLNRESWAVAGGLKGIVTLAAFIVTYKFLTKNVPLYFGRGVNKKRWNSSTSASTSHQQTQNHSNVVANPSEMNKPDSVKHALTLLYFTLALSVLQSFLSIPLFLSQIPASEHTFIMFLSFVILCLFWLLIYAIGNRKNWARITYLIIFLIGIPSTISSFPELLLWFEVKPLMVTICFFSLVLQAIALVFLFQTTSSRWFKKIRHEITMQQRYSPSDYYPENIHESHKSLHHVKNNNGTSHFDANYTIIKNTSQNTIITCHHCSQKLRVPNDKTVDVTAWTTNGKKQLSRHQL